MYLRTFSERAVQTFCLEIGGLCVVAPIYALFFDTSTADGFVMIAALSLAVMVWSPIHNTLFDWVEWRIHHRVASDRPAGLRVVHAVSHEVTSMIVSLPLLILLGNHTFYEALATDVALTLFYTGYTFVFHLVYDWWRPVQTETR